VNQTVAFKTIGCKVNQYETGNLRQAFIKNGYSVVDFKEKADVFFINTCAVTKEAERKSKQMIRKAARLNPSGTIIVTGCAVQANLREIKDCNNSKYHIVSNYYKDDIFNIFCNSSFEYVKKLIHYKPANQITRYVENGFYSTSNRIRGLVKIQDGCNQFCSYCVIPYLRGRSRSRAPKEIFLEINELASNNYKEIVLLGINLGSYGNDLEDENINLTELIQTIEKISGIERVRLSSIELPWVTDELINTFHNSTKLCHHLHIPLQSGDNHILSLMNRKYNTGQFEKIVKQIKENIPNIAITTDVIVGFPGEDDISFERTYQFIKRLAFAKIHVFPYSERPFNLASLLPDKVENDTIKKRTKRLNNLSKELRKDFFIKNIDQDRTVLVEYTGLKNNQDYICGLTDNYIKVCISGIKAKKGQMIKLRLKEVFDSYIEGEKTYSCYSC